MNAVAISLLLSLTSPVAGASAASPEGPPPNVRVTPDDGRDYQQPLVAVDRSRPERLAIAYMEGGPRRQRCGLALSANRGRTWKSETLVGPGGRFQIPEGYAACWNPALVYDRTGALNYVFQTSIKPSDPYSHVLLTVSPDGGATFRPPALVDPAVPPYDGRRGGGDWWPQLAVDPRSAAILVTWSRSTPLQDTSLILASVSTDGGRSFATPTRLSPPEQLDVTDPAAVVGPDGAEYVTWVDYTQWTRSGFTDCAYSVCQGFDRALESFYAAEGSRLDFTQGGWACSAFGAPGYSSLLGRGGNCHSSAVLYPARSSDGGHGFTTLLPVNSDVKLGCRGPDSPRPPHCDQFHYSLYEHNVQALAAGNRPRRLYLTWWDSGSSGGTGAPGAAHIHLAASADGGDSWRSPASVGVPAGRADDEQHRPWVSVAPGGRVDVVYYDVTPDRAQDVYWTSSADQGAGFEPPVRISDASSDLGTGPRGDDGRASFGQHLAVASTDGDVLAAWTDTRPGSRHQTVYFASRPVHGEPPSGLPAWPVVLALGVPVLLVAAGVSRVVVRRRRLSYASPRQAR